MPLYVTNGKLQLGEPGKLAAQRACCCNEEGDSAEDCFCPDLCIYQVQLLSPFQVPRFPELPCGFALFSETSGRGLPSAFVDSIPDLLPSINLSELATANGNEDITFQNQLSAGGIVNSIFFVYRATSEGVRQSSVLLSPYPNISLLWTEIGVQVGFFCSSEGKHYLQVLLGCESRARQVDVELFNPPDVTVVVTELNGAVRYVKRALYLLDAGECRRDSDRDCTSPDDLSPFLRAYATTPLELEINLDGTSLGPWQEVDEFIDGEISDLAQPGLDAQAAFSLPLVLRITQRPSCRIVACNCSTSLDGLKAIFEGKEFTLGTPYTITEGNTRWQHEIDGAGSYNFYKDTFLPENVDCGIGSFSVPVELITLSLYCATDSTADPPAPRWMVETTTVCAPTNVVDCGLVATGFAQRLFNGHIPCYEAEPGCVGPPGGAYIPIGDPIDIVEADGSPFLNPELPDCGAPNFPSFRIEQNCSA